MDTPHDFTERPSIAVGDTVTDEILSIVMTLDEADRQDVIFFARRLCESKGEEDVDAP